MSAQIGLLMSGTLLSGGALIDVDGTLCIQAFLFFTAMIVLHYTVYRPLIALFEAREEAIDGAKAEAKRLENDATQKAKAFEDELAQVRRTASVERERLRQDGLQMQQALLSKVRDETQKHLSEAHTELERQGIRTEASLKETVPALASQIASTLLGREVAS